MDQDDKPSNDLDSDAVFEKYKTSTDKTNIDGNQMAYLMKSALRTTTDKYISSVKFDWFKKCYPELHKDRHEYLTAVYQMVCSQLNQNLEMEIEDIYEEQNLIPKLAKLDEITQLSEHRKGSVCWRPSKSPHLDLVDHFKVSKLKHLENLQAYLRMLEAENAKLEQKVLATKAQLEERGVAVQVKSLPYIQVLETLQQIGFDRLDNRKNLRNKYEQE